MLNKVNGKPNPTTVRRYSPWQNVVRGTDVMATVEGKLFFVQTDTAVTALNKMHIFALSSSGDTVGHTLIGNEVDFFSNCHSEASVQPWPQTAGIWTFLKTSSHCPIWLNDEGILTDASFSDGCSLKDAEIFGIQFAADDTASVAYKIWVADIVLGKLIWLQCTDQRSRPKNTMRAAAQNVVRILSIYSNLTQISLQIRILPSSL